MAYNDYGAFVFRNMDRRRDKEDAPIFASDEEAFGQDINNIPSAGRIFANILRTRNNPSDENLTEEQKRLNYIRDNIAHGILGDGAVRVRCYKQGLPSIWELQEDGSINQIEFQCDDPYEYETIMFEYKGYKFKFMNRNHYIAIMVEPDGTKWTCEYDYAFGAGFEESD